MRLVQSQRHMDRIRTSFVLRAFKRDKMAESQTMRLDSPIPLPTCENPSAHIQPEIAERTVKTHTYHIYQKMGIHSQQELIDIVEREGDAPQGA